MCNDSFFRFERHIFSLTGILLHRCLKMIKDNLIAVKILPLPLMQYKLKVLCLQGKFITYLFMERQVESHTLVIIKTYNCR